MVDLYDTIKAQEMSRIVKSAVMDRTVKLVSNAITDRVGGKISLPQIETRREQESLVLSEVDKRKEEQRQHSLEEERKRIEALDAKDFEVEEIDMVEYEKLQERSVTEEEKLRASAVTLWRVQEDEIMREFKVYFSEKAFRLIVPKDDEATIGVVFGKDSPDALVLLDVATFAEVARYTFDDVSEIKSKLSRLIIR